jgi:hypothetical protein
MRLSRPVFLVIAINFVQAELPSLALIRIGCVGLLQGQHEAR